MKVDSSQKGEHDKWQFLKRNEFENDDYGKEASENGQFWKGTSEKYGSEKEEPEKDYSEQEQSGKNKFGKGGFEKHRI